MTLKVHIAQVLILTFLQINVGAIPLKNDAMDKSGKGSVLKGVTFTIPLNVEEEKRGQDSALNDRGERKMRDWAQGTWGQNNGGGTRPLINCYDCNIYVNGAMPNGNGNPRPQFGPGRKRERNPTNNWDDGPSPQYPYEGTNEGQKSQDPDELSNHGSNIFTGPIKPSKDRYPPGATSGFPNDMWSELMAKFLAQYS